MKGCFRYTNGDVKTGIHEHFGKIHGHRHESCDRSRSMWAFLLPSKNRKGIEITQTGNSARIEFLVEREGKEIHMDSQAAVV